MGRAAYYIEDDKQEDAAIHLPILFDGDKKMEGSTVQAATKAFAVKTLGLTEDEADKVF
jgi:hypothetical protein